MNCPRNGLIRIRKLARENIGKVEVKELLFDRNSLSNLRGLNLRSGK